jgi:hypothetical protein
LERNSTLQHLNISGKCRGDAGVCARCDAVIPAQCDCA